MELNGHEKYEICLSGHQSQTLSLAGNRFLLSFTFSVLFALYHDYYYVLNGTYQTAKTG